MRTLCLSDLSSAWAHADAWRQLSAQCPLVSPEWMLTWWKHYGQGSELCVVLCLDDADEVVGIAPFMRVGGKLTKKWKFLGSGRVCTDYASILARPDREGDVYRAIAQFLHQRCKQDNFWHGNRLSMEGVEKNSHGSVALQQELLSQGFQVWETPLEATVAMDLPATFELWCKGLSSQARRKAKRVMQRMDAKEVLFESLASDSGINSRFDDLMRLHQARRNMLGQSGCFHEGRFGEFLHEAALRLAQHGQATLELCRDDQGVIACHLILQRPGMAYMYCSGVAPDRMDIEPGHLLTVNAVRRAIEDGMRGYDFLRGEERYKFFWGGQRQLLTTIHAAPPLAASRLWGTASQRYLQLKQIARAIPTRS